MMTLVELLIILLFGGGFSMQSVPPTEQDPLAAKVAPSECLFYASWAGTATPDAASSNHTERMLAEPEVQRFLTEGRAKLLGLMRQVSLHDLHAEQALQDMASLLELVQGKPGALFLSELNFNKNGPPTVEGAGLIRVNDDAAAVQDALDRIQERAPEWEVTTVQIGAHTFSRIQLDKDAQTITWGVAGKHLLIGLGEGSLERLLERAAGQAPAWLTNIQTRLPVPRVASTMYIDLKRVAEMVVQQRGTPEAQRVVSMLGLDRVGTFATVSGMDDKGCVSRSLLEVDGAGAGLLSWIDAKPLAADDLKVIGHDAPAAVAFNLDAAGLLDQVMHSVGQIEPREAEQMREAMAQTEQQLEFNIREDLLKSLGDTWRIFAQPGSNGLVGGLTIAIQVRDRQKLERVLEILAAMAKDGLEEAGEAPLLTTDTISGHTLRTLQLGQPPFPVAPSWCLTDSELFVTAKPDAMRLLLLGGHSGQSLAQHPDVANLFAGNAKTLALAYVDTRVVAEVILPFVLRLFHSLGPLFGTEDSFRLPPPEVLVRHLRPTVFAVGRTADGVELVSHGTLPTGNIGACVPVAATVSLPVGVAMQASRRTQSMNNLKTIALGLQTFHDTYKAFPTSYNADKDGKPLLSWRVHILPFMEERQLYDQFHLDEPWDSPHNKTLIEQIPYAYRSPNSKAAPGMTNYLGVGGADGVFVRPRPVDRSRDRIGTRIAQITDGESSTIIVVEVPDDSAVIWTKPGDFAPNKEDPMRGLVGLRPGGFLAAFVDGSVQFIAESIGAEVNGLFTKSGGEMVRLP